MISFCNEHFNALNIKEKFIEENNHNINNSRGALSLTSVLFLAFLQDRLMVPYIFLYSAQELSIALPIFMQLIPGRTGIKTQHSEISVQHIPWLFVMNLMSPCLLTSQHFLFLVSLGAILTVIIVLDQAVSTCILVPLAPLPVITGSTYNFNSISASTSGKEEGGDHLSTSTDGSVRS